MLARVRRDEERSLPDAVHDAVPLHVEPGALEREPTVEKAALDPDLEVVDVLRVELDLVVAGPKTARTARRQERLGVLRVEVHAGAGAVGQQLHDRAELRAESVEAVFHHGVAVPEGQRVLEIQPVVAAAGRQHQPIRRLDAPLTEEAGDAEVVVVAAEPEELPLGPGRVDGIQVVERPAEGVRVRVHQVPGAEAGGPLVRTAHHQGHVDVTGRQVALDPRFAVEDVLVRLQFERILGERVGGQIEGRAGDVARVDEFVLNLTEAQHVDPADPVRELPRVVRGEAIFLLPVVRPGHVQVGQPVEARVDVAEEPAADDGNVRRQALSGPDPVHAHLAERLRVGHEGQLAEDRRLVDFEVRRPGVEARVLLARRGHEVAAPVADRTRRPGRSLEVVEAAAGHIEPVAAFGRRLARADVDRAADGGPPVERGVRPAHDLDAVGVVDRQVDDPRAVPRVRLRHAVDEQQRVRELVAAARKPAQHDGLERTRLGAHDHAGNVGDRLRQPLVSPLVDRRPLDDVRLRRDLADAERRLARRDLDAFQEVRRGGQLDGHGRRGARGHLDVRDLQLQVAGRPDGQRRGARRDAGDFEAADRVGCRGGRRPLDLDERLANGAPVLAGNDRSGDRTGFLGARLDVQAEAKTKEQSGDDLPPGREEEASGFRATHRAHTSNPWIVGNCRAFPQGSGRGQRAKGPLTLRRHPLDRNSLQQLGVRGQLPVAGRVPVRAQQEGDDVDVRLVAERRGFFRRHGRLDTVVDVGHLQPAPAESERHPGQARSHLVAAQLLAVALGAVRVVGGPAARGLRLGEDAVENGGRRSGWRRLYGRRRLGRRGRRRRDHGRRASLRRDQEQNRGPNRR